MTKEQKRLVCRDCAKGTVGGGGYFRNTDPKERRRRVTERRRLFLFFPSIPSFDLLTGTLKGDASVHQTQQENHQSCARTVPLVNEMGGGVCLKVPARQLLAEKKRGGGTCVRLAPYAPLGTSQHPQEASCTYCYINQLLRR